MFLPQVTTEHVQARTESLGRPETDYERFSGQYSDHQPDAPPQFGPHDDAQPSKYQNQRLPGAPSREYVQLTSGDGSSSVSRQIGHQGAPLRSGIWLVAMMLLVMIFVVRIRKTKNRHSCSLPKGEVL